MKLLCTFIALLFFNYHSYSQALIGSLDDVTYPSNVSYRKQMSILKLKLKLIFLAEILSTNKYVLNSEVVKGILDSTDFFDLELITSTNLPEKHDAYLVKMKDSLNSYSLPKSLVGDVEPNYISLFWDYRYIDPVIIVTPSLQVYKIFGFVYSDHCKLVREIKSNPLISLNKYYIKTYTKFEFDKCPEH